MRLQSLKLMIYGISAVALVALGARFAWFVMEGRDKILHPSKVTLRDKDGKGFEEEERTAKSGVLWWWREIRKELNRVGRDRPKVKRETLEDYSLLASINLGGVEPPKPPEPEEVPEVDQTKIPYDGFDHVKILTLILGEIDGESAPDDRVFVSHDVQPSPRTHLGENGREKHGYYRVGEALIAMPEIKVDAIDREKGEVTFRYPMYKDVLGGEKYENYEGNEQDSETQKVKIASEQLSEAIPSSTGPEAAEEEENGGERPDWKLPDGQVAPATTRERAPGTGIWDIGSEDIDALRNDYDERLRREVSVSSWTQGGKSGIKIRRIDENSVFFGRGLTKGDVILGINDSAVPTMSEAVRYIRENDHQRRFWIKVLRNGREREFLYNVPQ